MPPKGKKGNGRKGPLHVGPAREAREAGAAAGGDEAGGVAEAIDTNRVQYHCWMQYDN